MKKVLISNKLSLKNPQRAHKNKLSTLLVAILFFILMVLTSVSSTCSIGDLVKILLDINNHSSFKYQNRDVLNTYYLESVNNSFDDRHIYLVLSNTKTASSKFISIFTKKEFNHISLSFDYNLETLISYNGGNKRAFPGLNREKITDLIQESDSSALVYSLKVSYEQKRDILNYIKKIDSEGSSYNIIGLISNKSFKPNIMYCSQFINSVLQKLDTKYLLSANETIKPTDFIEKDYHRKLLYCYELSN